MRAYHRIDPLMDEKKSHYTPEQFGAFLKVQLVAGRQKDPGYFRNRAAVQAALPAAYVGLVPFLFDEGDLTEEQDGRVYVEGYKEWQEGDLTVAERMRKLRERQAAKRAEEEALRAQNGRKRNGARNGHRNESVTPTVTPSSQPAIGAASPNRNDPLLRSGVSVSTSVKKKEAPLPTTTRDEGGAVRLTKAALESWAEYDSVKWAPFRASWHERGFHLAPAGDQRELLWEIADARPTDLGRWVREAPGRTTRAVIDYVLEKWHSIADGVARDEEEWESGKAQRRADDEAALEAVEGVFA